MKKILIILFVTIPFFASYVFFTIPLEEYGKYVTISGYFVGLFIVSILLLIILFFHLNKIKYKRRILNLDGPDVFILFKDREGDLVKCQICEGGSRFIGADLQVAYYDGVGGKPLGMSIICRGSDCINRAVNYPRGCFVCSDTLTVYRLEPKIVRR
jgi:hypothetical protein